jgi:mitogen-activated protein kinase 1/3
MFHTKKDLLSNNISGLSYLFLVLEYHESDLKKVVTTVGEGTNISEEHIITIMYNTLCSINYMHSANIMHRDIKPANLLIDQNCSVKVCDFGLSRDVPQHIKEDQSIKILKAQYKREILANPELTE